MTFTFTFRRRCRVRAVAAHAVARVGSTWHIRIKIATPSRNYATKILDRKSVAWIFVAPVLNRSLTLTIECADLPRPPARRIANACAGRTSVLQGRRHSDVSSAPDSTVADADTASTRDFGAKPLE